ncbi:uncharacterized protein LOC106871581 isoform X1 [Octopus bimaculoides]|uniref:Uncharacterized protein n=1 Tax=Octopus bimaculoides TaxID=37653 RepID=A0A0L8HDQ7_OCTBM|nr:uncharacterized protein LOC106871581 isoform X1 [Octopus bimaculoides]|eukprot:XP_014773574.1 PREDICTED: uncharacterized protein LOC106871581 isoform X1 [Octopus bimaculoides]
MEEIVNYPEVHEKLMKLSCYSRKTFIDVLHKICEEESNDMMGILDQSRNEIHDMASSIQKEQKAFKETLHQLKIERTNSERNESRMSTVSCIDGVANGGRTRKKNKKNSGSRPSSVCSLPAASTTQITIEQEKETVFRNLDTAGAKLDNERKRQAARVEELKSRTRQNQKDNAHKAKELMEEANNLSKMLDKCKIEQQEKVKEIVENKRKKITDSTAGAQTIFVVSGDNPTGNNNNPGNHGVPEIGKF